MIRSSQHGGELTLVLSRPQRGNALSAALVEDLLARVQAAFADTSIHRLVLRGEGANFCSGLDLSELDDSSDAQLLHRLVRIEILLSTLWHAPIHTAAIAQGRAWGAGADLFAACEARVGLAGSSYRFPGALFGVVLGTRRLAEHIGVARARQLLIQGEQLDAAQALETGLATHAKEPEWHDMAVTAATAGALRKATRADQRDSDLAALVRSACEPGLKLRIAQYASGVRAGFKQAAEPNPAQRL